MHSLVRRFSTRLFNQAELLATVPGLHEACERRNVFENPPPDGFSATTFPLRWSDTAADRKAGATSSDGRPSIWDFLQRTMLAFEDVQYPRGNARARMPKRSFGEEGDDAASAPAHAHPLPTAIAPVPGRQPQPVSLTSHPAMILRVLCLTESVIKGKVFSSESDCCSSLTVVTLITYTYVCT